MSFTLGGRLAHPFQKGLVGVRRYPVVRVDEGDVVAFGNVQCCIARIAEPAILLVDDADAAISRFPVVTQLRTTVRRTVVHQNDFHVWYVLTKHTLHTAVEGGLYAVDWNDNGQFHVYKITLK